MSGETAPLLIDTHVLRWLVEGSSQLGPLSLHRIAIAAESGRLFIASFSIMEISRLVQYGAISTGHPMSEWIRTALMETRAQVLPMTAEIAIEAYQLPGSFHKDPADRLTVATARVTGSMLATRDRLILGYGEQRHVEVFTV